MITNLRAFQEVLKRNNLPTPDTYLGISELIRSLYRPDVSPNPERIREVLEELTCPVTVPAGNPITFKSCSEVLASEALVTFAPRQDLHGQSAPYPAGGWKNKLPLSLSTIKSENTQGAWNGNVYTLYQVAFTILMDSDENIIGVNANGTANGGTAVLRLGQFQLQANTYIFNGLTHAGSQNTFRLIFTDANYMRGISVVGSVNGNEITTESGTTYGALIAVSNEVQVSNEMFYPMIRFSTESDSTFAPYSNICSISEWDDLTLTVSDGDQQEDEYTATFSVPIAGGSYDFASGEGSETWEYIASYNGETLPGEWMSDRDVYAEGTTPTTGAEVAYIAATPTPISLTPAEVTLNKWANVISTDGDTVKIKFQILK